MFKSARRLKVLLADLSKLSRVHLLIGVGQELALSVEFEVARMLKHETPSIFDESPW